jgi:hypothetical protein
MCCVSVVLRGELQSLPDRLRFMTHKTGIHYQLLRERVSPSNEIGIFTLPSESPLQHCQVSCEFSTGERIMNSRVTRFIIKNWGE